jgi:hypothetical protein
MKSAKPVFSEVTDDLSSASKARYTVADENIMTFADSTAGCWHR